MSGRKRSPSKQRTQSHKTRVGRGTRKCGRREFLQKAMVSGAVSGVVGGVLSTVSTEMIKLTKSQIAQKPVELRVSVSDQITLTDQVIIGKAGISCGLAFGPGVVSLAAVGTPTIT